MEPFLNPNGIHVEQSSVMDYRPGPSFIISGINIFRGEGWDYWGKTYSCTFLHSTPIPIRAVICSDRVLSATKNCY